MSIVISLLPLMLVPVLYAALVKLAALLLARTKLRWSHALVFGLLGTLLGAGAALANKATGSVVPTAGAILIGLALQLTLGGWYFGPRAFNATGNPVRFKGGVVLSLLAFVLVLVVGVLPAVVLPALLGGG